MWEVLYQFNTKDTKSLLRVWPAFELGGLSVSKTSITPYSRYPQYSGGGGIGNIPTQPDGQTCLVYVGVSVYSKGLDGMSCQINPH